MQGPSSHFSLSTPSVLPDPQGGQAPVPAAACSVTGPSCASSSNQEKIEETKIKTQQMQQKVWVGMIPLVLKPLKLPACTKQMPIRDLINYMTLLLIQDLLALDNSSSPCLKFLASFQRDPYGSSSLDMAAFLLKLNEELQTPVTSRANYQEWKRALNYFIRASGCQNRVAQNLADLLSAQQVDIFCPQESESESYRDVLVVIEKLLICTLKEIHQQLDEIHRILKKNSALSNQMADNKETSDRLEILFQTFKRHEKAAQRLIKFFDRFFSIPNTHPGILKNALDGLKKTIKQVQNDLSLTKGFLASYTANIPVIERSPSQTEGPPNPIMAETSQKMLEDFKIDFMRSLHPSARKGNMPSSSFGEAAASLLGQAVRAHPELRRLGSKSSKITKSVMAKMSHQMEVSYEVQRPIKRFLESIDYQVPCLNLLYPLIAVFEARIDSIKVVRESTAREVSEALIREAQPRTKPQQKASPEVEELLAEEEVQELEIAPSTSSSSSRIHLPKPPKLSRWQQLQALMVAPSSLDKWKKGVSTDSMVEEAKLCMRHAAFHVSLLRPQLKLLLQEHQKQQVRYQPLLARLLVRSCSLITEQLLTAQLVMRDNTTVLTHYHLSLAQEQISTSDSNSWTLLEKLDGGAIFHRYPNQFHRRCTEGRFPLPEGLKGLLEPSSIPYPELRKLADSTLKFIGTSLQLPIEDMIRELEREKMDSVPSNPFQETLNSLCSKLDTCRNRVDALIQKSSPQEIPHWQDVRVQVEGLQLGLRCLIDYPQAEMLFAIGDILLAQAQYLDELIENGTLLRTRGYQLQTHDLEAFRLLRDESPDEKEQQLVEVLNGEDGTLYPHRYMRNEGKIPKALRWRFEASSFSQSGKNFDKEAADHKEGGWNVKSRKGNKAVSDGRHPLSVLREDLMHWMEGFADLCESRLTNLNNQ